MDQNEFRIITPTDEQIVVAFEQICEVISTGSGEVSVTLNVFLPTGLNQPFPSIAALRASTTGRELLKVGGTAFRIAIVNIAIEKSNYSIRVDRGDGFDSVKITGNPNQNYTPQLIAAVMDAFRPFVRTGLIDRELSPALAEFYNRREASLMKLEALSQRLVEDNESYRRTLDQQAEEHRKRVQAEFDEREVQREQQYKARYDGVEQRAKQLDDLQKELDDRESRHARRQIYKDLKETLKQRNARFTLSADTYAKRKPVNYVFWIMMAATLGFAISNLLSLLGATGMDWAATIRFSVSTAGFFGTAVYYIRWLDRWSQQHADEEYRLKRIDVDVDRSSWLAEMVLEWEQSGGGHEFPKELLNRLSNGLFDGTEKEGGVRHPAEDALRLLLRPASGLRLGIPGLGEVSYDRSGIKRLEERGQAAKAGE